MEKTKHSRSTIRDVAKRAGVSKTTVSRFLSQLALDDTPVVLVDGKIPALGLDTEAILHLVEQGYEHIAFFTEPVAGISTRMERLDAFSRTLRERGLYRTADEVYEIDLGLEGQLAAQLDRFLERSRDVGAARAIFAQNGVIMLKLLLALQAKGLQVPSDLAVAGFDDLDWAPVVGAGITTVAQPTYEIGVTAMERVLHRLRGDSGLTAAQTVELQAKLIVRGSTPRVKSCVIADQKEGRGDVGERVAALGGIGGDRAGGG